jgi:flagellar biogenesis protein FliO
MPLSKVALVRSALLFIVVALVALISIVGVTLWLVDRTQV